MPIGVKAEVADRNRKIAKLTRKSASAANHSAATRQFWRIRNLTRKSNPAAIKIWENRDSDTQRHEGRDRNELENRDSVAQLA